VAEIGVNPTCVSLRRLGSDGPLELRIEHRAAACPPSIRPSGRTVILARSRGMPELSSM